ncbi:MAG: alcohol dehydrogenase catalytic domain-containing protein, partial [Armatimonadota bacterium]|nr:alcohol dehydrogenase catalytic domain-containing protein [Armatimonadota bacterium]
MLAAWLSAPYALTLRELPIPEPAAGEVVVRMRLALTCGTDLKTYRRGHAKLPFGAFGHEGVGEVVAVGEGVTHVHVGQRITWLPTAPCGECSPCQRGRYNLCRHLFDAVVLGTYAEYLKINARVARVHLFPLDGLSDVRGAFLEPLACVLHAWRMLEPLPGKRVCILGTGAMGYLHLMEAVARRCAVVIVGRRPERLQLARDLGAHETVQIADNTDAWITRLQTLTDGGADVVIEATGAKTMWELAPALAAPGGKVLFYSGLAKDEIVCVSAERWHYDELTLLGSFHFTTQDALAALKRLRHQHRFPVERLISDTRPLREIVQVFEQ